MKSGKLKRGTYAVAVSYPQFDGPSVNFAGVNRTFADRPRETVASLLDSEFDVSYEQSFDLYRLSSDVVSVWIHSELWQASLEVSNTGTLVDLRTGKTIPPEDVFMPGDAWRKRLIERVDAELGCDREHVLRVLHPAVGTGSGRWARTPAAEIEGDDLPSTASERRSDEVEAAWQIIDPLLNLWDASPERAIPGYAAGTWGPAEADALLAKDGYAWRTP